MQITGIREFRSRAPELLKGRELVFVTRHGKVSSLIVPLNGAEAIPVDLRRELIERLGGAISTQLARSGVTEKRVERDFKAWRDKHRARRR
ncbi:MAG: hypothetical protein AAB152_11090 [Candidatus Coatesbacteria bacterium]